MKVRGYPLVFITIQIRLDYVTLESKPRTQDFVVVRVHESSPHDVPDDNLGDSSLV